MLVIITIMDIAIGDSEVVEDDNVLVGTRFGDLFDEGGSPGVDLGTVSVSFSKNAECGILPQAE